MTSPDIANTIRAKLEWVQKFNHTPSTIRFDISVNKPLNDGITLDYFHTDKHQIIEVIQLIFPEKKLMQIETEVNEIIVKQGIENKNCLYLVACQYWQEDKLLDN